MKQYFLFSSLIGIVPMIGTGYYNISKAALDMVTKQFAIELGPHQIRVNSVNPSVVQTASVLAMSVAAEVGDTAISMTPLRKLCTELECVNPIMYLLSDQSSMVTGTIHVVDGGLSSRALWF